MTTIPTKLIVNCVTNEQEYVPMSAEEIAAEKEIAEQHAARMAEALAAEEALAALKASAKAKLISGEPLTAEEADTLVI